MDGIWWVGFIASICIALSLVQQSVKLWKIRRVPIKEFSFAFFSLQAVGSILFLYYGFLIDQIGLVFLNFIGIISVSLMLLIYLGVWRDST